MLAVSERGKGNWLTRRRAFFGRRSAEPRESGNPWLSIPAADYEGHMGHSDVRQLQFLNRVFREILGAFHPGSIAVLGCSTGNGFEHIDTDITRCIIGIDINREYLRVLESRFGQSISGLKLLCSDITGCELELQSIDLVHCALILEYVGPSIVVEKAASWLRPGGCLSVVLQLASTAHDTVTDTGVESVKRLEPIMRLIEPEELGRIAGKAGLRGTSSRVDTLESGKQFYVGLYEKPGT